MGNVSDKCREEILPHHHVLCSPMWALASSIEIKNKDFMFSIFRGLGGGWLGIALFMR